ncbi:MAG: hypothetical protein WBF11_06630 [Methyloceanibacter sp.]
MTIRLFGLIALTLLLLPATAPACFAGEEPGRYTLAPAGSGFLRLDSATGALSHCRQKLGGWTCEGIADDVSALKQEIDRLAGETDELKQRLAKAEAELESQHAEQEPFAARPSIRLPGAALDEMNEFVDRLVRRLQDMVRDLKQRESERAL